MRFPPVVLFFLWIAVVPPVRVRAAADALSVARSGMEQWVQTEQLISRTQSDWEGEREMLRQTKALYERELAGVEAQMAQISTNSTQADRERSTAEQELQQSNMTLEKARAMATELEGTVRALLPRLPAPLLEMLQPILNRLPAADTTTRASATERIQAMVSLLNEIDKFNNAVGIFAEKRRNNKGEEVAVETVYVGLGAAWFVNETGDFGGIGRPGDKGWEWTVEDHVAPSVAEVIKVYRSQRPARFVALPVTIR